MNPLPERALRAGNAAPAILWILSALFAISSLFAADQAADPSGLTRQARQLVLQPNGRQQAETLLRHAVELWEQQPVKPIEYADTLELLGMSLNPGLAHNKEGLATQVEPLYRKAVEIRRKNPESKPADLALSLELEAQVLEQMGRVEDSRDPKARARALRDQIIIAMQPPPDDVPPDHMGNPGLMPPRLVARSEPELTFAARVLKLQVDVIAEVVIGADGGMRQIEIYRPAGFGLDESAVAALLKWRFLPAQKSGIPVPVEGTVRLQFH